MNKQEVLDRLDKAHSALVDASIDIAALIAKLTFEPEEKPLPESSVEDRVPPQQDIFGPQGLTVGELRKWTCLDCGAAAWPHPYRHRIKLFPGNVGSMGQSPPVNRSQMKIPTD